MKLHTKSLPFALGTLTTSPAVATMLCENC